MKKLLSIVLALALMASMLTVVPALADDKTVINYWTNDRHDLDYIQSVIDTFNAENTSNIEVKINVITDDYENQITLAYTSGDAPDVIGAVTIKNFVDNGMLLCLDDYIAADETYQLVNEPYTHAYEGLNAMNGNIYWCYSAMRSGVRIEYNKSLLEKSGYDSVATTIEGYIEQAKKITEDNDYEYYGVGFTSSSPFERQLEMMAQVSGIYYYDYVNGKFDFSGYKEIMELGRELVQWAYPDQQGVDNMRALFAGGSFALWGNASQEAGVFTNQFPVTDFEWGVAEVPSLTGEIKGALQTTPSKGYAIMSSSKNPDAAWEFVKYMQSESVLVGYVESGAALPITSYIDERVDKTKLGRLADYSLLEYESVYPAVPAINLTGDNYRTVIWNAIMGFVDIDAAIEDLNTRYNAALDADVASGSIQRLVIADYDPLHPSAGTVTYLDK